MVLRPGRPLFTVGQRSYDQDDVIVAAILRGEWQALVVETRQGLEHAKRIRRGEDAPDSFDLGAAAQEFRYARNLISAEETEAWLARAGIRLEDWFAYLERSLLRNSWVQESQEPVRRGAIEDEELRTALRIEAVCSGALQRFTETLAARAAVCQGAPVAEGGSLPALDERLAGRVRRECVLAFGEDWNLRIAELARLEETFHGRVRHATTPEAVQAQIDGHRLDWLRVRWRYLRLGGEQAAREAVLCLRHDRESLEDVALRAGVAVQEEACLVESLDATLRAVVVCARPGDLLAPWPAAGGFQLALLLEKAPPFPGDPEIRGRAEEAIRARLVRDALKHVRWHGRL